jgi:squalene-associated FAD-dependent desaturase
VSASGERRSSARVAVIGAGWAGLAAAVRLVELGRPVTLFEMAACAGGRARGVERDGETFDNGQHILIGAYRETLALMRRVGADPETLLHRQPLTLVQPGRLGLVLPPGSAVPSFVRGVLANHDWTVAERLALLAAAGGWAMRRFRCAPATSVGQLCARLPARLRDDLIDPLCVAALNTPAAEASASVLLRVLRDALFGGRGAADLLLPRATLDRLLPSPALAWLAARGADIRLGRRVATLRHDGIRWRVDDEPFAATVLACPAAEAARLTADIDPDWATVAAGLRYEPIATVLVDTDGARLAQPMMALQADEQERPAQFVFDLGALGAPVGRLAFVISGAAPWVVRGRDAIAEAVLAQARQAWPAVPWARTMRLRQLWIEKRATFRCTPALHRPRGRIAPGLWAAGDHVAGPYPATLEGAVRSGLAAADAVGTDCA